MHTRGPFHNLAKGELWARARSVKGGHHKWDSLQNSAGDTGVLWRRVPQFVSCPPTSPPTLGLTPSYVIYIFFSPKVVSFLPSNFFLSWKANPIPSLSCPSPLCHLHTDWDRVVWLRESGVMSSLSCTVAWSVLLFAEICNSQLSSLSVRVLQFLYHKFNNHTVHGL